MTDNEIEKIAVAVAEKISARPVQCQVFSAEEILWVKGFFDLCKRSRVTAISAIVSVGILGMLSLLSYAVIQKIRGD